MPILQGRCWTFGRDVNTDAMAPGASMSMEWDLRRYTLFPEKPEVAREAGPGDVIIAGENFGCGSSREQAVHNLIRLGIATVIAESFGRIFFRNAIANGLPAIACPGVSTLFEDGDNATFQWSDFSVTHHPSGKVLKAQAYAPEMIAILEDGGMLARLKRQLAAQG